MDPDGNNLQYTMGLLAAAAVLIILSMIFSASESAYLSINKLRIRFLRSKKDKRAIRVGKMLDKKARLLNTVLIANNIVNIAVSSILTYLALQFFGPAGVGIAALGATVILLIFGEISPKTIAVTFPERIAFLFSPVITAVVFVLTPLERIFALITKGISRLFGISVEEKRVSFTEEEIKTFIDVGEEEGVLEAGEKTMLHRVFKFTDLDAKDIMTPRIKIVALQLDTPLDQILELSHQSHYSRFPVYDTDIDSIRGIAYIKDILFFRGKPEDFSLKKIMRAPLFILENKKMSEIQYILQENNQNMAVVLDEYSGTAGLLTMEDLAEEIFGSIIDEHDAPEKASVQRRGENEIMIDGSTRLGDISERLHIKLESEFYDTIGGFIAEKLGEIPSVGNKISESGYVFYVAEAEAHHVLKVLVKPEDCR